MREIKFRAWDKVENKWLFGYDYPNLGGFSIVGEVTLIGELNSVPLERWNDVEIMQYTGLKDKNGKEIYEGDILAGYRSGKRTINNDSVVFEAGKFKLKYTPGDLIQFTYSLSEYQCEVIGNIYENPELLQP